MKTLRSCFGRDSAYWGSRGDWLVLLTVHRDSEALDRSNFECAQKALPEDSWAIERANHWAIGWIDYLLVDPGNAEGAKAAETIEASLGNYPVLDEQHYCQMEMDEANSVWQSCYRERERVKYIREHRSEFDFRSFADLLGCVRGKYFCGYASELLH